MNYLSSALCLTQGETCLYAISCNMCHILGLLSSGSNFRNLCARSNFAVRPFKLVRLACVNSARYNSS